MFKVGKVFHLAHVVEDLDPVDRWYDEVFGCERYYRAVAKFAMREASLLVISDLCMEPIQVAKGLEGADKAPIGRFLSRFGPRFHSIAWYVDDLSACVQDLGAAGLSQMDVAGRPIDPSRAATWTDSAAHASWTHPRETHAVWEFAEPGFAGDPRLAPGWTADRWRDEHPLGIERTSHLTVTFEDVDLARPLYEGVLHGTVLADRATDAGRSVYFEVGEGVVEARQPAPGTRAAADIESRGEGVFAMTFEVVDIGRAAEFLASKDQVVETLDDGSLLIQPEHAFGITVGFTQTPPY